MSGGGLRIARFSDAVALAAIYAPYVEETTISFEWVPPTADEFEARMRAIISEYPYLVYEQDGEILGYAYAHRAFERYSYRFCAELSVYIRRDVRQKGIGTLLYRTLIELCRKMRLQTLYGVVTNPNEPSFRLHERLGFERVGYFPHAGQKFDRWIDVVWYSLVIGCEGTPPDVIPFSALEPSCVEAILNEQLALYKK
jgi:phosphinothricin acetyltransferase